jgi:hypothetical protein
MAMSPLHGDEALHLLAVDGETGTPARLAKATLLDNLKGWRLPGRRLRENHAADELDQAGWGVVYPEQIDPAIREALAPLVRQRRGQAGERFAELTYRSGEGVAEFHSRLKVGFGPVNPDKVPYYLLLVGDAEQIPHAFQAGLDVPHAVGRLHLASVAAYARYAEAVVRSEAAGTSASPRLAIFSPTHGNDTGTRQCAGILTSGLISHFTDRRDQLDRALVGGAATRTAFVDLLAGPGAALVFAAGHGVMYASGHRLQRDLQGSLVGAEWSGSGRVEMAHLIAPSAVPDSVGGPPRVLFLFGCFTGGTPRWNSYDPGPRGQRREVAETPFIAQLPQALLERGALAVIAHIDQAFTDAFLWEKHGQLEVFQDSLASILDGHRIGFALEAFAERYAHLATEMIEGAAELGDGDMRTTLGLRLWTAYHDARGVIVLGDPAVRLSVAQPATPASPA